MAKLSQYIPSMPAESKWNIWVQIVFFAQVGSGSVLSSDDFSLSFAGQVSIAGIINSGVQVTIALRDRDMYSSDGPADVVINGAPLADGHYQATSSQITITGTMDGQAQSIILNRSDDGREAYIGVSGKYSAAVHLAPA